MTLYLYDEDSGADLGSIRLPGLPEDVSVPTWIDR